ncbi:hypothetical protein [Enterobacter sp. 2VL]|uniref:hypothetical protein n=1 Tax=Enterobacter sp. 2VL TaxID=2502206 RepID=UPI0010FA0F61|nr:hypothetical protein [Enterobacter sp. 2VL]
MVKEHYDVKSLICVIDKEDIDMDYIEGESCIRLAGFFREAIHEDTENIETFTVDMSLSVIPTFPITSRNFIVVNVIYF